jgi:hypothetical protein
MFNLKCVGSKIAFVSVDHIVDTSGKVYGGVTAINVYLRRVVTTGVEDTSGKFAAVVRKFVPSVDDAGGELEYFHKFVQKSEMDDS